MRLGFGRQLTLDHLAVFDCLRDLFYRKEVERITIQQKELVWAHAPHIIRQLPLVFPDDASPKTHRNKLSRIMDRLRRTGLIETTILQGKLHFRPTDRGASLYSDRALEEMAASPDQGHHSAPYRAIPKIGGRFPQNGTARK